MVPIGEILVIEIDPELVSWCDDKIVDIDIQEVFWVDAQVCEIIGIADRDIKAKQ